jgi:HSP20 family protein
MFNRNKKSGSSFLEKLTGVGNDDELEYEAPKSQPSNASGRRIIPEQNTSSFSFSEEDEEGELAVDVFETNSDIIVQTMTAGVRPEELTISITPESITIRGRRDSSRESADENFMVRELYWGSFSRTIELPKQIDPDLAEAIEKHGLLMIRLPKLDKEKTHRLKVKSI